ncbi:hypothetical protein [Porphyrobacter sp. ULC335]|uniref:hypothetical protein n=1 Tax=Porphyrobacter sp. ULC335 TaxID=2854260 RepID=UPI00221F7249|nr:hypothetical protein [Porphyrobacter sp. ULC335]UYV14448.1 hypothetical protein KVF90_09735 [Porphyrobacter sp. ULC335]
MSQTKTCSTCRETKPVSAFYRNGGGKPGYRTRCKGCLNAARRNGPSAATRIIKEIVMHHHNPAFPLSPEAEAVVYTSMPLPPAIIALRERREQRAEKEKLRRERAFRAKYRQCPAMTIPAHMREAVV